MAVKDRRVALTIPPGVRCDDDMCREVLAASRTLVLRVRRNVATPDVLDRDVADVEPDVVTRLRLRECLAVHLNSLVLRPDTARRKQDHRPGLQDAFQHAQQGQTQSQRSCRRPVAEDAEASQQDGQAPGRCQAPQGASGPCTTPCSLTAQSCRPR